MMLYKRVGPHNRLSNELGIFGTTMRSFLSILLNVATAIGPSVCCCNAGPADACCTARQATVAGVPQPAGQHNCCCDCCKQDNELPAQLPAPEKVPGNPSTPCPCVAQQPVGMPVAEKLALDVLAFTDWVAAPIFTFQTQAAKSAPIARFVWPGGDPATFLLDFCHILRC
jgi:hypothetical protein